MAGVARPHIAVIGAGPAGLTAAYEIAKHQTPVTVFESDRVVGGISRTVERDGWRFDVGGHSCTTSVARVDRLWHEILPEEDFLTRPQGIRFHYRGALLETAPNATDTPSRFRSWLRTLADRFPMTQRVSRTQRASKTQRISEARFAAGSTSTIEFEYPKYGPGMLWERCADHIEKMGGAVILNTAVTAVHRSAEGQLEKDRATALTVISSDGSSYRIDADHIVSSMPLAALVRAMDPPAPPHIQAAADALHHHDLLTVALVVPERCGFPDTSIEVWEPTARVGRILNFGAWSPYLVKAGWTTLGLEYLVGQDEADEAQDDEAMVRLAICELNELGLVPAAAVEAGYVVRVPRAVPVHDAASEYGITAIRDWLTRYVPNVHPVGRNGLHRDDGQDLSLMASVYTAENILDGTGHDVWARPAEEVGVT